jgi:hypothetical protein
VTARTFGSCFCIIEPVWGSIRRSKAFPFEDICSRVFVNDGANDVQKRLCPSLTLKTMVFVMDLSRNLVVDKISKICNNIFNLNLRTRHFIHYCNGCRPPFLPKPVFSRPTFSQTPVDDDSTHPEIKSSRLGRLRDDGAGPSTR